MCLLCGSNPGKSGKTHTKIFPSPDKFWVSTKRMGVKIFIGHMMIILKL